jgi:hypothetical protein
MSQTKTQLVANVPSGFNVTGVVTATKFDGALATNATGTNLTLSGDLTVQGSQTIINSDTLDVKDKTVGIASTSTPTSATQDGSGIEIYGPSNVTIKYDDQKGGIGINTGLTVTGVGTFSGAVTAASFSGSGSGLTGIDKIEEGNTTAEVVDTGSDGHFKVTTEGTERVRVVNDGKIGIGTNNPQRAFVLYENSSGQTQVQFQNTTTGGASGDGFSIGLDSSEKGFLWNYEGTDTYIGGQGGTSLTITNDSAFKFSNSSLTEKVKITAGKLSDNQNINLDNGMVHYFTTTETTTSTPNITASAGINTIMSTGDTMVVTLITTAAAGGYSAQLTIEGAATTENWIGGEAPAAGGASGVDIYSYTIIKTGSAAYTVIGNLSKTSA